MRALLAVAICGLAPLARGDVSLDARRSAASRSAGAVTPLTPLGPACDAALAAAQARFSERFGAVDFHLRERRVVGDYRWSDMCGVWGNYSIELAPDRRAASDWRWRTTHWEAADETSRHDQHRRGVKRSGAFRAVFDLYADNESNLGDWFVESFQPAIDVCLANASE